MSQYKPVGRDLTVAKNDIETENKGGPQKYEAAVDEFKTMQMRIIVCLKATLEET